eukprot:gene15216-13916_t
MWTLLLLAVTVVSTRISVNPHMLVVLSDRRMDVVEDGRSNVEVAQSLLVRSRMTSNASITKALLCIAPKAGTTSILEWFIQLSAGESYKSCRSKLLKAKIKTRQQIGYLHDVSMNKHSPGCQALFAAWFFKIMSKLHKNANPRAAVHAKLASTAGVRGLQFACT